MSKPMQPGDPAYWMLLDEHTSTPVVFREGCYICEDLEFAQMGLPLCRQCPQCVGREIGTGHVPADDDTCDDCGFNDQEYYASLHDLAPGIAPHVPVLATMALLPQAFVPDTAVIMTEHTAAIRPTENEAEPVDMQPVLHCRGGPSYSR